MAQRSAVRVLNFKGLILDYGEVLSLKPTEADIERMARIFGISAGQFNKLYNRYRREYDRGDLDPERYWFSFADEPGLGLSADQIPQLRAWDVDMWSNANSLMTDWLRVVHLSGVRTALLSNMPGDMIARVRKFPWIQHFDCTVFSYEERLAKPEPAIYQRCLEKLGTAPDQTLFVDDRELNVQAARKLGIEAIRFESAVQLRVQLEEVRFPIFPGLPAAIAASIPSLAIG